MEFTVGSAFSFGWETFKKRPWLFALSVIIVVIAQYLADRLPRAVDGLFAGGKEDAPLVFALIGFGIYFWLGLLINMGMTAFFLAAHDAPDTVELTALWHPHPFWKYVGVSLLLPLLPPACIIAFAPLAIGLASVLGSNERGIFAAFLLLLLLCMAAALIFIFAPFLVIDRELGPIEAMKESYRMTRGHLWNLLGLYVMIFVINVLGIIALIIGLLVSIPVSLLAYTHAYRVLSGTAGAAPPADTVLAA